MAQIEQLLAKAMSTDSEDEAIACLRMARKQGKSFEPTGSYKGKTAQEWYKSLDTVTKAYIKEKLNRQYLSATSAEQEKELKQLHVAIRVLVVSIPVIITITGTISYFMFGATVSCWLF